MYFQKLCRKTAVTSYSVYAVTTKRHDVCARRQQDQPGWFGKLRKDALDGANNANN